MHTTIPATAADGAFELCEVAGDHIRARVRPAPDDPMYTGHFPGFPITPGVYIVGFVHHAVRAAYRDAADVEIVEIVSCRFLGPAFPGDELVAEVTMSGTSGEVHGSATVSTERGPAVELRFRLRIRLRP